jgi:hypothetical protein
MFRPFVSNKSRTNEKRQYSLSTACKGMGPQMRRIKPLITFFKRAMGLGKHMPVVVDGWKC